MAPRRPSPAQTRERRARLAAIGLGVLFLIIGAIQGPKLFKAVSGGSSSSQTAEPVASTSTGTPSSATPAASSSAAPSAGAGDGQLDSFSLLASKDPFHSQMPSTAPAGSTATGAAEKQPAGKQPASGKQGAADTKPAATVATTPATTPPAAVVPTFTTPAVATGPLAAVVRMNGHRQVLPRGTAFPLAEPIFRVVSVGAKRVRLGLVTGSFADGSRTLKLRRGHKLTLVDRTNGIRYVFLFVQMTRAPLDLTSKAAPAPTTATPSTSTG
jgi:hypothetical protein